MAPFLEVDKDSARFVECSRIAGQGDNPKGVHAGNIGAIALIN